MPRVSRTRVIASPRDEVWALISNPHHLPRWWPKAVRVEDVRGPAGGRRSRWTLVLGTKKGRGVRADYRCTAATEGERCVWTQDIEGTPFQKILRAAEVEIVLAGARGGTAVTLSADERLRGLSRLGSPMMRQATRRRLDEALDGLARALED